VSLQAPCHPVPNVAVTLALMKQGSYFPAEPSRPLSSAVRQLSASINPPGVVGGIMVPSFGRCFNVIIGIICPY